MRSAILVALACFCAGCESWQAIIPIPVKRDPKVVEVSYQTRRVPVVTIENRTSCHLETLVENVGRGVIVRPHSVMTIYIVNIPRNPSLARVWLIAMNNVPGMSQCHFSGEIEKTFRIPDRFGEPIPLWVVKEDSFE